MSISKIYFLRKRTTVLPFVVLFLIFSIPLLAQNIELLQLNHYSFYTDHTAVETVIPNIKAVFVNDTNRAYFNLSNYHPGTSTGVIIGKIDDQQVSFLDTLNTGTPDQLTNFFIDDNGDITFSASHWNGGVVKKISWDGQTQWENTSYHAQEDTIVQPYYCFQSSDGSTVVLQRQLFPNFTFSNRMVKLNSTDGSQAWVTDFLTNSNTLSDPILAREINNQLHTVSYNVNFTVIAVIDQAGVIQSISQKPNNEQIFVHKSQHIDQLGNVYLGKASKGYRFTKINASGDTLWLYHNLSPFGDETTNNATQIATDQNQNVFVAGLYTLEPNGNYSMLTSKLSPNGELIWEQYTHDLLANTESFIPRNSYVFDNKLWYTGTRWTDEDNRFGALICYDLDGNFQFYKEFEELSPKGTAASLDFLNNELLITGSTGGFQDSISQHILHYRIDTTTSIQHQPQQILVLPYPNPTSDYVSIKDLRIDQVQDLVLSDSKEEISAQIISFHQPTHLT